MPACKECAPPPDMILSMPPPPLPNFLLPRSAIVSVSGNNSQPCFAAFMCEPNFRPREIGIEFIELDEKGYLYFENTWLFIVITSCVGVLILGVILAFVLIKCREYKYSYQEANLKQTTMAALGEQSKSNPFLSGGMLYPCPSNRETLQQQMATDNRLLWATLTPEGHTRHFVTDFPIPHDGNYEIVDYRSKFNTVGRENSNTIRRMPIKTFENNGFTDYDNYEDPTPLMDSYHDDLDSGYQEPQECISNANIISTHESIPTTLSRSSPRPLISSPTHIENPNLIMPPLNLHQRNNTQLSIGTLRRSTLGRSSDLSYN